MTNFNGDVDWERTVVLELNREHEYICRVHKVNLRPIAITLFDSESFWGQFDNLTRTISISRKLVNEFPWHQVVGVFRHEMAHQFVAEQHATRFHSEKPHSELFKEACKRLGVPDQFAKAGLDLQSGNLDWRIEPRNEATEKILDKVKKLLALATSTNEHEALLAMERVRDLYAKYNLEHIATLKKESFVHLVVTHGNDAAPFATRTFRIMGAANHKHFDGAFFCQGADVSAVRRQKRSTSSCPGDHRDKGKCFDG